MSIKNCKMIGTNGSSKRVSDARIVGFDAAQAIRMTGSLQAVHAEANYSRSLAESFNVIQVDCASSEGALERSIDAGNHSLADGQISLVAGDLADAMSGESVRGFGRNRCVTAVARPRPARYTQQFARAA